MADLTWLNEIHPLIRALVVAATGGGVLGFLGLLVDKIWPSAKDRMEHDRLKRVEDDVRIAHLEKELQDLREHYEVKLHEARQDLYNEQKAHIKTQKDSVAIDAQLEILASRLGVSKPVLPSHITEDREDHPPGVPHDDREEAP